MTEREIARAKQEPVIEPDRKEVRFEQKFLARSPANFNVQYGLRFFASVPDFAAFKEARLSEKETQTAIATEFNDKVFAEFLESNSYRFHFCWDEMNDFFYAKADMFAEKVGKSFFRDVSEPVIGQQLSKLDLQKASCRITATEIIQNLFPDELIERNYAMIPDEEKKKIQEGKPYHAYEERLAIAALKRRLDFFRHQYEQTHDSRFVSIRTERAGRAIRLIWQFKENAPSGLDLVGYRKAGGGFHPNQWDETQHGTLIVQSSVNNELTEFLKEGETYFYTFLLRPPEPGIGGQYAGARFQITIATDQETRSIEETIKRIERSISALIPPAPPEPPPLSPQVAEALKEIGFQFDFETRLDEREKEGIDQINKGGYSDEERKVKITRFRALCALVREKYQQ